MYVVGCLVTAAFVFLGVTTSLIQSDDSAIVGTSRPQTDEIRCGPPHYCARTDRNIAPYPEQAPVLRAAGSVVKDPAFGSPILRVTDSRTPSGFPGWSFHTPSSSEQNTWSANARRFYVEGEGGRFFIFDFDPDNFLLRSTGLDLSLTMQTEAEFSYVNPDVIYGWGPEVPPRFLAYNIATKKVSLLHDPNECIKVDENWRGLDISASRDDQRLMGVFGPQQDNDPFVYIYDRKQGCRWYNTSTGEIGGHWGPKGSSSVGKKFLVHNARISKSGQYVAIAGSEDLVIWTVDTLEAKICTRNDPDWCGGHRALGYSHMINPAGKKDSMNLIMRPFDNLPSFSQLIRDLPKHADWNEAKHLSWNNANPSDTAPVCLSTYRDDNPVSPGLPLRVDRAWDSEILCVGVGEEKNKVWRFAHNYTTAKNGFWSTPRGNVSQDGRFYIFSSDWEDTLGEARNSVYRTDVFLVELK
jgi:hypothetical protein